MDRETTGRQRGSGRRVRIEDREEVGSQGVIKFFTRTHRFHAEQTHSSVSELSVSSAYERNIPL